MYDLIHVLDWKVNKYLNTLGQQQLRQTLTTPISQPWKLNLLVSIYVGNNGMWLINITLIIEQRRT